MSVRWTLMNDLQSGALVGAGGERGAAGTVDTNPGRLGVLAHVPDWSFQNGAHVRMWGASRNSWNTRKRT